MVLLNGEYDYSARPEDARATAAAIPGARAVIMKGLGHFPMSEDFSSLRPYLVPVLEEIGTGWENGTYALSQVYMSGRICEELVDLILPPTDVMRRTQPKIAIATLEDYHMLGKRIVYLPIGSLSPQSIQKIRIFHVLSDHQKRKIAKDYIW